MEKNDGIIRPSKENPITLYTSCYKCNKELKVEYYDDNFESYETVFLGRKGTKTIHYCPYCGEKNSGFSPYDINEPMKFDNITSSDDKLDDDENDVDSWWPDSDGAELIPDDTPEKEDPNPYEMDNNAITEIFTCSECSKSFRLNPKGCKKIHCLYCGSII